MPAHGGKSHPAKGLARAPGTPGVPQPALTVFTEDFENGMGNIPVPLTSYTGATPTSATYTADVEWLTACNGDVLNFNSTGAGSCPVGAEFLEDRNRQGAWAIGQFAGVSPTNNHAVTALTANNPGPNKIQFQTANPIALPASNRFMILSLDYAAQFCPPQGLAPKPQFFLLDGGIEKPVGGVIDACSGSTTITAPTIGAEISADFKIATYTTNGSVLIGASSAGIRIRNMEGGGGGNDGAFDNIKLFDATPQLDKSFAPASTPQNTTSTLTFTITNTSDLASKNGWAFADALPTGLTVAAPAATTTCPAGVVNAPVGGSSIGVTGNLDTGMASCTVTVTVTSPDVAAYTNGPSNVTGIGINPPADATVAFTPAVDLSSSKTVDNPTPHLGDNVVFTITLTNNGPSDEPAATLTDKLPAGLTYVSDDSASTSTTYDPATGLWTVGPLAKDESKTLKITAKVETTDPVQNLITGTSGTGTDPSPCPPDCGTPPPPVDATAADLTTAKTVDNPTPDYGSNVVFTVTATNNGPDPTTAAATVTDKLPAGLTYVSDDSGGTYNPATGIWTVGVIAKDASKILKITAKVTTTEPVENVVTGSNPGTTDPTPCPGDCGPPGSLTPQYADLEWTKMVDNKTPIVGSNVTFTVTLHNKGNSDAPDAKLTDKLPSGLTYVSSTPSKGTYDPATGVWTVGLLPVDATETLHIVATVNSTDPASTTNKITDVSSGKPDPTPCVDGDCGDGGLVALSPQPPLPVTGERVPLSGVTSVGLGAILAGAALIVFTRRRRAS